LIITDNNGQIPINSYCFVVRRPQGAAPILWGNPGLGQETIAIHIGSIIFEFGNCSEVRLEVISRDVVHGFPVFTAVVSNIIFGPRRCLHRVARRYSPVHSEKKNPANGRIAESSSPAGAPIMFAPKKDGLFDFVWINVVLIRSPSRISILFL